MVEGQRARGWGSGGVKSDAPPRAEKERRHSGPLRPHSKDCEEHNDLHGMHADCLLGALMVDGKEPHAEDLLPSRHEIMSTVGDLHAQPLAKAPSAASLRLGATTRMAQDLGLHPDEVPRMEEMTHLEQLQERALLELRRRVWSACVIMDRCRRSW